MNFLKTGKDWLSQRSLKQKIVTAGIVIIFGLIAWNSVKSSEKAPTYQFTTVQVGDITDYVSETGEVVTNNKTEVSTTIDGVISKVLVQNGDTVKKGDSLFEVESTATQEEKSRALADYQSAKASLDQAKASQYTLQSKMLSTWDSYKELSESDDYKDPNSDNRNLPEFMIPEDEWLAAEADYKSQEQVIAKAQASLNSAWLAYQATTSGPVKATANGVVANLAFAVGQQVSSADTALIIKTDGEDWVKVGINESDITNVEPGQTATITLDALEGKEVEGQVQRVDEFGTDVSDVILYYVYLTLNDDVPQLRPGMTAQVDIITQQKQNILLVPNSVIKPYQGEKAVQVLDPQTKTVIYKPVTLGVRGDTHSEVLSGLSEGDQIISSSSEDTQSNKGGGLLFGGR